MITLQITNFATISSMQRQIKMLAQNVFHILQLKDTQRLII